MKLKQYYASFKLQPAITYTRVFSNVFLIHYNSGLIKRWKTLLQAGGGRGMRGSDCHRRNPKRKCKIGRQKFSL